MQIHLTEEAKKEILKQNPENKNVRIYVSGIGWGGPKLGLSLEEAKGTDEAKEVEGLQFIVDDTLRGQNQDVIVDFAKSWFGKQFIVSLKDSGGCC